MGRLKLSINQGLHLLLYSNDLACLCPGSEAPWSDGWLLNFGPRPSERIEMEMSLLY